MEKQTNSNKPEFNLDEGVFWEEILLKKLSETEILWQTHSHLKELFDLTINSEEPRVFSKIKGCIDIVQNDNKNLEIRKTIMDKVLTKFFPLFTQEDLQQEPISEKQITDLATSLGEIITNHEQEDDFKNLCQKAFMETIILRSEDNLDYSIF